MAKIFAAVNRGVYAMAPVGDDGAEIRLYGDIVEQRPLDWWTDEPIEGDFIVQDEFLADLDTVISSGTKKLTLHIHSFGGDVGASLLIHNRLLEARRAGMEVNGVVDGVAMSGGSLILCACGHVAVNPGSIVMIHKCWSLIFGGYNADELRQYAAQMDGWDSAQKGIYAKRSGLSETVVEHMMSETTYLCGREAVEKGFAEELLDTAPVTVAASANRRSLYVAGRKVSMPFGVDAPENLPVQTEVTTDPEAAPETAVINQMPQSGENQEGGNTPMARNLEELRAENAELAAQVEADVRALCAAESTTAATEAANAERDRLRNIDEIAALYDPALVADAKYGEHPMTAEVLALEAARRQARAGQTYAANVDADAKASGAADVSPVPASADKPAVTAEDKIAAGKAAAEKVIGGKN